MNKKSQGLSVNVIIIVAIALIVLIVLITIFTGRMGGFIGGVDKTLTCANSCSAFNKDSVIDLNEAGCNQETRSQILQGTYEGIDEPNVCCCIPKTT